MFAHIVEGTIVAVGHPPNIEWDGERWWDLRDPEVREARGWLEVTEIPRPADTETETHDLTYEVVGNVPTQVWTARLWTPEELEAQARAANEQALRNGLANVITAALERQATSQAVIDTPNSEIKANPQTHVVALARATKRQDRAIIRLARLAGNLVDSVDTGTD